VNWHTNLIKNTRNYIIEPKQFKDGKSSEISGENFPTQKESNYDEIRDSIKTGDLLFCSGNYRMSKWIRNSTDSPWSHVAIIFRVDAFNHIMVLESIFGKGVRTVPLSKYLKDYDNKGNPYEGGVVIARHDDFDTLTRNAGLGNMKKFTQHAVNMLGYPYDNSGMVRIAYLVIKRFMGFNTNCESKRDKEYICSEYVEECFRKISVNIEQGEAGFLSPADFAKNDKIKLTHVLKSNLNEAT
jgi:hypothetical protein